jgi:hypothetical protein
VTSEAVACATEQNVLGEGARLDARRDELLRVDHYQVIRECSNSLRRRSPLIPYMIWIFLGSPVLTRSRKSRKPSASSV